MKFHEKLARLTEEQNKGTISKSVGLPSTAISNYLSKKQLPRIAAHVGKFLQRFGETRSALVAAAFERAGIPFDEDLAYTAAMVAEFARLIRAFRPDRGQSEAVPTAAVSTSSSAESSKQSSENSQLHTAIERLKTLKGSTRNMGCMKLSDDIFQELCARLLDRRFTVTATAEWLRTKGKSMPTKSSVARFSSALLEEYRLVISPPQSKVSALRSAKY